MGYEIIVYGAIVCPHHHADASQRRMLQERNAKIINDWPNDWPWLNQSIALPGEYPRGTYLEQVIHFGLSLKVAHYTPEFWDEWFDEFELLLRQLYWRSARVHVERGFGLSPLEYEYLPTAEALKELYRPDEPVPISAWERTVWQRKAKDTEL